MTADIWATVAGVQAHLLTALLTGIGTIVVFLLVLAVALYLTRRPS